MAEETAVAVPKKKRGRPPVKRRGRPPGSTKKKALLAVSILVGGQQLTPKEFEEFAARVESVRRAVHAGR